MSEHEREVVAVRVEQTRGHGHVTEVELRGGERLDAADVIREIDDPDVHVHYVTRPPEGSPAYQAHQETGRLLELQTRPCPDCGETTLWG